MIPADPKPCRCKRYPYAPHWHYPKWLELYGDKWVYMMLNEWWPGRKPRKRA